MRIATWNINNVNLRLPLLLAWLEATQAGRGRAAGTEVDHERLPNARAQNKPAMARWRLPETHERVAASGAQR